MRKRDIRSGRAYEGYSPGNIRQVISIFEGQSMFGRDDVMVDYLQAEKDAGHFGPAVKELREDLRG